MKTNIKNLLTSAALFGALICSLSSCEKDDDETVQSTATISLVNSVEGSAAQDVYLNDSKANVSAVAYGSSETKLTVPANNQTIAFKNSGTATTSASANVSFSPNSSHTIFLVKKVDGSLAVNTYANDDAVVNGKAKVRFINVAPLLAGAINVTLATGASVITPLTYTAASAYQTIDAATTLNVNMTGSLETTTIANTTLQAGKVYTIWFDSSTTTKVKYHVIVHN